MLILLNVKNVEFEKNVSFLAKRVENDLKNGKKVLFFGTGCREDTIIDYIKNMKERIKFKLKFFILRKNEV